MTPHEKPLSITSLMIEQDDPEILRLRQPGLAGNLVGTAAGLGLAAASWLFFDGHHIAFALFLAFAAWSLAGAFKSHQLTVDIPGRRWSYRNGWFVNPPLREGGFQDLESLSIESHSAQDGLVSSRLRGHALWLVARGGWRFRLGPPMGPLAAEDRAETLARRLGLPVTRPANADASPASPSASAR